MLILSPTLNTLLLLVAATEYTAGGRERSTYTSIFIL
jgi:hypothetical protein